MKWAVLALCALSVTAKAADSGWNTSWDGTLYGYVNNMNLRADSVLNPGNKIAALPQRSDTAELRIGFKAQNEVVRLTGRPILSSRVMNNEFGTQQRNEGYFSQWQMRVKAGESWNVAAGREVLNWGPAQFRSPSSPFYFDNGRNEPMRELIGMDAVKLSWTPDMQSSVNLAHIVRSGKDTIQMDMWRESWLAKFDLRGENWAYGVVTVQVPRKHDFYGAHGQVAMTDALMLYGEIGSSVRAYGLNSSADAAQPFIVETPSSRSTASLAGAAYTFEDGKSLSAEYLHESGGYTAAEENAYFARAVGTPDFALGMAPRLLGRDYLHMVWQSYLLGENDYWRLMYTRNLGDGSNELSGYGEAVLASHLSIYALVLLPIGNERQEFSTLYSSSVTAGVKIAMP